MTEQATATRTQRSDAGKVVFTSDEYFVVQAPDWFREDLWDDCGVNRPIDVGGGRVRWGFADVNEAKMKAAMLRPTMDGRYARVVKRVETDILV